MGDDFARQGPPDTQSVNLTEDRERRYWARKFGVSERELAEAVAAVGTQPDLVRRHARGQKKSR